jgi:hypothetical protein
MAKLTDDEIQQLKDAVQWKLDEGDVRGADNLMKAIQLTTKDESEGDKPAS